MVPFLQILQPNLKIAYRRRVPSTMVGNSYQYNEGTATYVQYINGAHGIVMRRYEYNHLLEQTTLSILYV